MKLMLLLLGMSLQSTFPHDIQVTFFTIHQLDTSIIVDVDIEAKDIILALEVTENELNVEQVQSYLKSHFLLSINDTPTDLTYQNFKIAEQHIEIQGVVLGMNEKIENIAIQNNCFLNIENHSNIIELKLNQQERDFLMDIERTSINVSF